MENETKNIDQVIGRRFYVKDDYTTMCVKENFWPMNENLKGKTFTITDTVRTCGFYFSCQTDDGYSFVIFPDETDLFEEIKDGESC